MRGRDIGRRLAVLTLLWAAVPIAAQAQVAAQIPVVATTQPGADGFDYRRDGDWARLPDAIATRGAPAVFLVHMTTFAGAGGATASPAQERADPELSGVLDQQMPVFADCCAVYAPYYAQASLGTLFAAPEVRDAGYDRAYRDIRAAFANFLTRTGDAPIVLFGHSQGALHVLRLLREEVADTPVADRLIAAYVIGLGVADAEPGVADRGIAPCATPVQTGCYLGWSTFLRGADVTAYHARNTASFAVRGGQGAFRPLCSDAILSAAGPRVDPAHGACVDGVARVDPALAASHPPVGAGNMHYHDITLFVQTLRDNLAARVRAWFSADPQ